MSKDLIDRQAAIQPEQQYGRIFKGIVVEYPSYNTYLEYEGKPYFSIKYTENGQEFIGYGTYSPEVLSEYLKEYFMPSAQPTNIQDILEYLDTVLHPIISPEHWNIYSELHDMISVLSPPAQPEPKTVRDTLNSMTDDEFANWLCHQIFPDYAEDNADNILRYKSVMNFLKMDIKQAKEGN